MSVRRDRKILRCKTCAGEPNLATAYPEKIEDAINSIHEMPVHRNHYIAQVEPGQFRAPYDMVLARVKKGYFLYGVDPLPKGVFGPF